MAQAYQTTYKRCYRQHEIDRRKLLAPHDNFCENSLPAGGKWLIRKSLEEQKKLGLSLADAEEAVKQMYKNRYWSTYQLHYCQNMIPKEKYAEETAENELLESCRLLYKKREREILPPRPSARRVFGYLRPTYCYTPLSMYQFIHGTTAYKMMEENNKVLEKKQKSKISEDAAGDSETRVEDIKNARTIKGDVSPKRKLTPGKYFASKEIARCECWASK